MATCPACDHYAYMRVDGSMRCVSCNYDSSIPEKSSEEIQLEIDELQLKIKESKHKAAQIAGFMAQLLTTTILSMEKKHV